MKSFIKTIISASLLSMAVNTAAVEAQAPTEAPAVEQQVQLNINTASAEAIAAALKGVGLKKAQAIVAYRDQFGHFKSLEELTDVKGIGAKTLEKNATKIAFK